MKYDTSELAAALRIRNLDRTQERMLDRGSEGADVSGMVVHYDRSDTYDVGYMLADLDREARRTIAFLMTGSTRPGLRIGFDVEEARKGDSITVLLSIVASLALSDPVQFAITLNWFWEHRPQRWGIAVPANKKSPQEIVNRLADSADEAIKTGQSVHYYVRIGEDGSMEIDFRSGPAHMP